MKQRDKIAFKYRKQLKTKATQPEKKVKRILRELGIDFKFQRIFFGKRRFVIVDFYLPKFHVVLEIDGEDHYKEENKIYDEFRTKFLMNRCHINEVIRIPNKTVRDEPNKVEQILVDRFCEVGKDFYSQAFMETIRQS